MAKSKSFFGMRTGSTKSLTFSILRGQQITKDRVSRVSNPQNLNQGMIRSIFSAAAKFYAKCRFILDHSWEGIEYGTPSQAEFMKHAIASRFGTSLAKGEAAVPFNYQVSHGSLPSISSGPLLGVGGVPTGRLLSSLQFFEGISITAFRELNNLLIDDNITLLGWDGNNNTFAITYTLVDKDMELASLDPSKIEGVLSQSSSQYAFGDVFTSLNEEYGSMLCTKVGNLLNGAVILSRKDSNGKWLRSSESFTMLNVDTTSIEGAISYTKAGAGVSIESEYQLNEEPNNEINQQMQLFFSRTEQVPDSTNPERNIRLSITANMVTDVKAGSDGKPIVYCVDNVYDGTTYHQLCSMRNGTLYPIEWSAEELASLGVTISETATLALDVQLTNNQLFTIESVSPAAVSGQTPIVLGLGNVFREA